MTDSPSILFVCTGNLCRSPMAEVLFRQLLQKKLPAEAKRWKIGSAGTWTDTGKLASSGAQNAVAQLFGLSLTEHRSSQISEELMNDFNLILVMEYGHKEALQIEFPGRASRVFLLSEMVGARFEIEDPLGGETSEYLATARQIENLLEQGWNRILPLAETA